MTMPTWFSMRARKAWNAGAGAAASWVLAPVAEAGIPALLDKPTGWWLAGASAVFATFVGTYNAPNVEAPAVAPPAEIAAPIITTVAAAPAIPRMPLTDEPTAVPAQAGP